VIVLGLGSGAFMATTMQYRWLLVPAGIIGTITGFELIFVLTDGGPAFASQTLGMWVFNQAFFSGNRLPGFASAIAMVQFAIVFVIAMIMQYYLRRREAVL